ncbi:beta-1,3-glucan-binding protein-like [Anoplophora glabripennis]|uniref:beta-1,3-glucan-binding protein-like n=1 Tax=Anoplophora glabripennis TaxID=217634 RepID=UPI00087511DC|nr:beta-1,3-glucan-binding protein-like [Anoplophora glabripennis]
MLLKLLAFLWCSFVVTQAQYEVPDAKVEVFSPKGFSVSIPDHDGIRLFAFHGKINEELTGREAGTFSEDILKPKNGWWTFHAPYQKLQPGDKIYYWTYVEHLGRGYPKDDQMYEVTELIPKPTSSPTRPTVTTSPPVAPIVTSKPVGETGYSSCQSTPTKFNNGKGTCKGKLLYSHGFSSQVIEKYWTVAQQFAGSPDYEFVIYVNRPETIQIVNRKLKMKPVLSEDIYGSGFVTGDFNLGENCTGTTGSLDCVVRPDGGFILPPVLSSQISTKRKFSFKYGTIEIKAKLPKGDWIYPELYLNSANEDYGPGYGSGQIRIAFAPGNSDLNQMLQGGIILGDSVAAKSYGMKTVQKQTGWSNEYHTFKVTWKPESIILAVDGKTYGTIYPPSDGFVSLSSNLQIKDAHRWRSGTTLAPFDKEMYITLGVGVGGFNFEDRTDGSKPWRNGARSSMKDFYNAREQWSSTWNSDNALDIALVKVWAL